MIVAIGVDVDDTFARFVKEGLAAQVHLQEVNLRAAVQVEWRFDLPAREVGVLRYGIEPVELDPHAAFFCRLIDLSSHEPEPATGRRWQGLLNGLRVWLEAVPGTVANRPSGGAHNSSKPLHESILRDLGLQVPESLTSCDREALREFAREGAVSKPVCGIRAHTERVTEADFDDFEPASGPVHLQRLVDGDDARIHVAGDRVVAQRVSSNGVDYRRAGGLSEMKLFDPPASVRSLLVRATEAIGLTFSGWDFKIDADDNYWCFEANPMPGYSPYDAACDGAISRELLSYLQEAGSK
jgi:hypothetical protein